MSNSGLDKITMPDRFDGAPYEVKASRTVWAQGKGGDNFKPLPMGKRITQLMKTKKRFLSILLSLVLVPRGYRALL